MKLNKTDNEIDEKVKNIRNELICICFIEYLVKHTTSESKSH